MAAVTLLGTATFNTTAGNKTVTTTPAVGDLIVVIAATSGLSGGTTSVTDNQSGTYTQVDSDRTGFSTTGVLTVWVRDSLISSATSTVFTANQSGSTGGGLVVLKVTGMTKTGASAVRSNGGQSSGTAATTPAPVLSNTPLAGNPIITAVACGTNSTTFITERTSYTGRFENGYNTPTTGLHVSSRDTGETSATLTYGSTVATAFASVGIELDTSLDINKSESVTVTESRTIFKDTETINKSESVTVTESGPNTTQTLVDSYSETNANTSYNHSGGTSRTAQSFTGIAGTLDSSKFYLKKFGSPTGDITSTIYAHAGTFGTNSVGTGAALATSDPVDIATLTTSDQLVTFNFSGANRITLSDATKYVVAVEFPSGSTNLLQVAVDTSSPTHAGNVSIYDGSWLGDGSVDDAIFYVYTATTAPAVEIETPVSGDKSINKSESVTVTESVTVFRDTTNVNVSDTATLTESVTVFRDSTNITVSDTTTLTESVQRQVENRISVSDTTTITEAVQRDTTNRVSVSDTSTLTESLQREVTSFINKSDSTTVTDTPQVTILERFVSVSDTATLSESISVTIQTDVFDVDVTVSDSVTVSENLQREVTNRVQVSDTSTLTESVQIYQENYVINKSDTATLTENVQRLVENRIFAFDTTVPTDSPTVTITAIDDLLVNVSDTATITENRTVLIPELLIVEAENVTVTENRSLLIPELNINKSENVTVTESVNLLITELFIQETENVSTTENVIVTQGNQAFYNVITSENVTVSEQVTVQASDVLLTASETATVSESVSVSIQPALTPAISVSDTTTVTENAIIEPALVAITVSDTTTLTDAPTVSVPTITWSINVSDSISGTATQQRNYYIDSDGNIYWVINQALGLVEKI